MNIKVLVERTSLKEKVGDCASHKILKFVLLCFAEARSRKKLDFLQSTFSLCRVSQPGPSVPFRGHGAVPRGPRAQAFTK